MILALQKTLVFISLIGIGLLLKSKISSKEQIRGIKTLILSIALPATIFIALLKIEIRSSLLYLPLMALGVNFLLLYSGKWLIKLLRIPPESSKSRTLSILIPSFAPGLSCFPFIVEFFGEQSLAMAAFADVGNKFFVLIFLYILALNWFYRIKTKQSDELTIKTNRLNELWMSLVREPINVVLVAALAMLCLGLNFTSLPLFLQDTINRMSLLMTPLVLLFIGIAVKFRKKEILLMFQVLLWRSGMAFLISGILVLLLSGSIGVSILMLVIIFPQSAISFWPFAHMSAIDSMEGKNPKEKTFDLDLGLNLLAFSLPFSTLLILLICSFNGYFANPLTLLGLGISFISMVVVSKLMDMKEPGKQLSFPGVSKTIESSSSAIEG